MKRLFILSVLFFIFLFGYSNERLVKDKTPQKINKESYLYKVNFFHQDSIVFYKIKNLSYKNNWYKLSISEIAFLVGNSLMNTPYVVHTLDLDPYKEFLIANLHQLDCATFVENVIAISRLIKLNKLTIPNYFYELRNLRYSKGVINGYTSRLHYASQWAYYNMKRGIYDDITKNLGGIRDTTVINFMSKHPQNYKAFEVNPKDVQKMKGIENLISKNKRYFIPKNNITLGVEKKIKTGDIILIKTNVRGLDIAHQGIAVKRNNRLFLMHASSVNKKVIISDKPLAEYVLYVKHFDGIVVLRLK